MRRRRKARATLVALRVFCEGTRGTEANTCFFDQVTYARRASRRRSEFCAWGAWGGEVPPQKTPRQRSARSALYLRTSEAKCVASYSKAHCEAMRQQPFVTKSACRVTSQLGDKFPLREAKPRALVQEATRYARRRRLRAPLTRGLRGGNLSPHTPRARHSARLAVRVNDTGVRMFCVRHHTK